MERKVFSPIREGYNGYPRDLTGTKVEFHALNRDGEITCRPARIEGDPLRGIVSAEVSDSDVRGQIKVHSAIGWQLGNYIDAPFGHLME